MSSFRYNDAKAVYLIDGRKIQFRLETTVDGEYSGIVYATFKSKTHVREVFGKEFETVNNDDLVYFIDPFRGSEYHQYLEEAALKHVMHFGDKETDYRNFSFESMPRRDQLIFVRHFGQSALDFTGFDVPTDFNVKSYIEERFADDFKLWGEIAKEAGKSLTISYRPTEL